MCYVYMGSNKKKKKNRRNNKKNKNLHLSVHIFTLSKYKNRLKSQTDFFILALDYHFTQHTILYERVRRRETLMLRSHKKNCFSIKCVALYTECNEYNE
jgi:hypothetical protein